MEHPHARHRDAGDGTARGDAGATTSFDVNPANPSFNHEFAAASAANRMSSHTGMPEMTLHHGGKDVNTREQPQRGDNLAGSSDRPHQGGGDAGAAIHGIKFKNIDASHGFVKDTHEAFRESFGRLKPEIQEKLNGLKVVTAAQASEGLPGVPRDTPAVTPDIREGRGNMMVFGEQGIKRDHDNIKDVMNHELWHAVDNATGGSRDLEMRKAIDMGIKRLTPNERRQVAGIGPKEQQYAELAGDAMAMEVGSKPKSLSYVHGFRNVEEKFKEARELMRKRYLRED